MFARIFLVVLLAYFGLCAIPSKTGKLYNGSPTTIGQAPYIVAILDTNNNLLCAGAIVGARKIYTVASCLPSTNPSDFRIRVGSTLATSGGTVIIPQSITIHPSYNSASKNDDIAYFTMSQNINYSNTASIPLGIYIPNDGAQVTVSGWGATKNTGGSPSYSLQSVRIPVVRKSNCATSYFFGGIYSLADTLFCAGNLGYTAEVCAFDLGDPVVINGQLVGLATRIKNDCGYSIAPSVFTSISKVQPF